jgi:hypothetical protein
VARAGEEQEQMEAWIRRKQAGTNQLASWYA